MKKPMEEMTLHELWQVADRARARIRRDRKLIADINALVATKVVVP